MKEALLTILRNKEMKRPEFRNAAQKLSYLIAAEAAESIPLKEKEIHTPLGKTTGKELSQDIILVPILRAGLALLPAFLDLFPDAKVGVFGIKRDGKTALPELYYEKLPKFTKNDYIFLLDPMLATGGSATLAIHRLLKAGATPDQVHLWGIIAAKPGLEALARVHPRVTLHLAATDSSLDTSHFIIPGLGDFGDRYFGNI